MARLSVKRPKQRESTARWLSKEITLFLAAAAVVLAVGLLWLGLGSP